MSGHAPYVKFDMALCFVSCIVPRKQLWQNLGGKEAAFLFGFRLKMGKGHCYGWAWLWKLVSVGHTAGDRHG